MNETPSLSPQDALVMVMIATSASDEDIRTAELLEINGIMNNLPVFAEYDVAALPRISQVVFDFFEQEDGLDALFGLVRDTLPKHLWETAYALACDVAAADGRIVKEEARMLQEIRHELQIDRLASTAIERGARARHMTL